MTGALPPEELVRRIREVVEDVPPGCTTSYGDVAHLVGTGPRQVGRVMATCSAGWPWWRVTRADGTLPDDLCERAAVEYAREGTPMRGGHADRRRSRWDPWGEV